LIIRQRSLDGAPGFRAPLYPVPHPTGLVGLPSFISPTLIAEDRALLRVQQHGKLGDVGRAGVGHPAPSGRSRRSGPKAVLR